MRAPTAGWLVLHGRRTTAEMARHLSVSTRTLERWRADGTGPPWFREGRRVFYDRALLERWLEERTVWALPPAGECRRQLLHIVSPPTIEQPPKNVVAVDRWGSTS